MVYFFLHKTSFPSGFPAIREAPVQSRGTENPGQCGPRLTARHLCRTELSFSGLSDFFVLFPHGLQDRGLLLKLGGLFAGQRLDTFQTVSRPDGVVRELPLPCTYAGSPTKAAAFQLGPSKNTCKRLSSRFISTRPPSNSQPENSRCACLRAVRYASLPGGSPHCCW